MVCSDLWQTQEDKLNKRIANNAGYLVCMYMEAGNVEGKFLENVQAKPSELEQALEGEIVMA